MIVHTEIEIASSPANVRKVFLDFSKIPDWTHGHIRSIEPETESAKEGVELKVVLQSMTINPTVLENSPGAFKWRGSGLYGAFVGEHTFRFEPSTKTPGSTTFIQSEEFSGALSFLMASAFPWATKTQVGFEGFNEDLKAKVESLKQVPQ